jgi:hypothetical protein
MLGSVLARATLVLAVGWLWPAAPTAEGAVVAAALALAAVFALALVVSARPRVPAAGPSGPAPVRGPGGEDRHRSGAFRRQHAPGTPGRPGRPRAPGFGPRGSAR